MKHRIAILSTLSCMLALVLSPAMAQAANDWQLKISVPQSPLNSSSFTVQYTALAIDAHSFTVQLYQDETLVGTQVTSADPNGVNGNSGAFPVTAPDGHHTFHLVATRASDNDVKTADVAVDVDATAPAAPTYLGKSRTGNTYTIQFTAPTTPDVKEIRIYSSTSLTFTANSGTQVGVVAVAPGQTTSFTYTASSSAERFHAVRAFDAAGNGSTAVGDSQTVITTTTVGGVAANVATNAAGQAAGGAGAGGAGGGQVQGAATTVPQTSSTTTDKSKDKKSDDKKGSVLGAETTKDSNDDMLWPAVAAAIAIVAAAYYWLFPHAGRSLFHRGPKV